MTEISSPDENSFLGCNDSMLNAIEAYVKYKLTEDPKLEQYRLSQFYIAADKVTRARLGVTKSAVPSAPYRML